MKNLVIIIILAVFCMGLFTNQANALINIDDESIKISIKYGLDNKYSTSKELLGPNWIEGENGVIISIYSPFIQLATKAKSQNVPGATDEDIILVKRRLGRQLNQIKTRQDVRFIVQIVGDDPGFAQKFKAHIEEYIENPDSEEAKKEGKGFWIFKNKGPRKAKKITPGNEVKQPKAELDHYNPVHPYSATNSYNFTFAQVDKYDKFYFVLTGADEKPIKFLIDKNAIF